MKKTILIIEDNEKNIYLFNYLLENAGYDTLQALESLEGLKLAKTKNPSLIILDINLPIMDGYTIFKKLREDERTKDIPVIAVTSLAMSGDKEKILDLKFDGYMEKPINPKTFVSEIERYFKK